MWETRMDAHPVIDETATMNTALRNQIAGLLAQARDITQETLGSTPGVVVAEVFRALHMDSGQPLETDGEIDQDPHRALH